MDDFYLNGVWVAFLVGLVKVCISVSSLLSIRARNLKKIGLYYSCINGTYTSSSSNALKFISYLVYMLIIAPIFSWLSVGSSAWGVIAWLSNRAPVPENIKAIQWKIAHVDLPKEQLIELQEELAKILGTSGPVRVGSTLNDDGEEEDQSTLVIDPGEYYNEVRAIPQNKTLKFYGHTPDYDSIYHSIFEYKFEGDQLFARLLEDYTDHYSKIEWHVRDGVVLESEMRKKDEESKFKFRPVEEEIESYAKQILWQPFSRYDIRFFVMTQHPELFPRKELRRLVRLELERLKLAVQKVTAEATKLGIEMHESDEGLEFRYPKDCVGEKKEKVDLFFSAESLNMLGTSSGELYCSKKMKTHLLKLLGEEKEVA